MTAPPIRPRLVAGLLVASTDEGLVFDGTARRQVLRGPSAHTLLPRLLPLLDGDRPVAGVVTELADVAPASVDQAVRLLWERGLVEDATSQPAGRESARTDVAGYVGRLVGSTSHNRNSRQALARMAAAEVIVVADATAATVLAAELTASGLGRVRTTTAAELTASGPSGVRTHTAARLAGRRPDGRAVVVARQPAKAGPAALHRLDDWCAAAGIGWLRTAVDPEGVEIGPFFAGRSELCHRCFSAGHDQVGGDGSATAAPADLAAWASLVAIEVCYLVARIGRTISAGGHTRFDLRRWTSERQPALRQPGCERCCPLPAGQPHPLTPAYAREQASILPARALIELADHRIRPTRALPPLRLALRGNEEHLRPEGAPSAGDRLPATAPGREHAGRGARGVSRSVPPAAILCPDLLTDILDRGLGHVGPSGDRTDRTAAISLAALSPVQAYVHMHRIAGLRDGWYWWRNAGRVFVPVRTLPRGDETTAQPDGGPAPGAVIALTGALAQLEGDHGAVGHRLCYLATGLVVHALLEVLARAGRPAGLRPDWDEAALAAELRLDPAVEPVTAVIDVSAGAVPS